MRARVGPILPPTPSTMMSPSARARSARSSALGCVMKSSSSPTSRNAIGAFSPASVCKYAGLLDDRAPLLHLGLEQLAERAGVRLRYRHRLGAEIGEARLECGRLHRGLQ